MSTRKIIRQIQSALTPDLLKPNQLAMLTGVHNTEGHCYIAAEAAFHMLGGKAAGWVPVVLPRSVLGNNTHWWIENRRTKKRVDPTAEQWGDTPIPYHLGVPCGFLGSIQNQPSKRARIVIERALSL